MLKYLILAMPFLWTSASTLADGFSEVETTLQCVNQKAPDRLWNGIDLGPARIVELSEPYVFVHGALGWHITWGVLFDAANDEVIAYETYGAAGDLPGAFGRMKIPWVLRKALAECNVEWKGLWPHDWPEQRQQEIAPPFELTIPVTQLPLDDLLPPRQ